MKSSFVRRCHRAVFVLAIGLAFSAVPRAHADRGTGGIPAVLEKLEELSEQIERNQQAIQDLKSNTVPCTLDRFVNDQCGDYNQPFDLSITLCANAGANGAAAADFQINNNNEFHLGVGFAEILDVALVRNVEFPGIPGAGVVTGGSLAVFGIPFPNLQAGVDASAGVGLEGCIDIPIRIRDIPREQIIALMTKWQAQAKRFQDAMMAASDRLDLAPRRVESGLDALEVLQSRSLSEARDVDLRDPIKTFSRNTSHGDLLEALPIGSRVQEVLDKPEMLIEGLSQDLPRPTLADAKGTCDDFLDPNAPALLSQPVLNMCRPLEEAPDYTIITNALDRIRTLPDAARVKNLICDNVTLRVLFSDCD